MTANGYYHYDPTNFHGPLHFYLLFSGADPFWAPRAGRCACVALFSIASVVLALAYRPFLGRRAAGWAAMAWRCPRRWSFTGRYAIHESELLFFLMLAAWGFLGMAAEAESAISGPPGWDRRGILTKETYVIHLVAFYLGVRALLVCLSSSPGHAAPVPRFLGATRSIPRGENLSRARRAFLLRFGLDLKGLLGIVTTFATG